MNRRLTAVTITSVAALALSGCISGTGGPSGGGQQTASGGKVSITFASYAFQDLTVKATQEIVDSWNTANPNIQVEYQKVDPNSVHDKLVTQFAGNQAPDIIHDESADIAGFSSQGYLADMTSLLPANLKSDVPASVWKTTTFNGKVTGVPTIAQVYNLFANTDA
ncbi:MAG: extracellular solute-binding protein, partial [Lapillicoccus sp.]